MYIQSPAAITAVNALSTARLTASNAHRDSHAVEAVVDDAADLTEADILLDIETANAADKNAARNSAEPASAASAAAYNYEVATASLIVQMVI
jgi:hypothetical protein